MPIPVIVDAVRTPFGNEGDVFADTHPQELVAETLLALEQRNDFDPSNTVEDVVLGCVTPVGKQGSNIGRLAPLVAGWDVDVPGVQLNRMCGSGQQSVNFAAANVRSGYHDVMIAGGVEHMSDHPMGADVHEVSDGVPYSDEYFERHELITQGEAAERIANRWDVTQEVADRLAVDSQHRWKEAWDAGCYDDQIVPIEIEQDGETVTVDRDEHPRSETDMETLSDLPLVFREEGDGIIHAGNSSGIVDGASALLVASEAEADARGWDPLARIVDTHVVGVDPSILLTGPIPATNEVLEQNDMTADEIDLFECNEAFASVVNAWLKDTGATWDRTNVWGGAIAHGHPVGATGGALVGKLAHQLQQTGGRYGLSTLCIGHGMGIATIIERA